MGMFGSRKKIYVSSAIYNLSGNYAERTNYMKHITLEGIFNDQPVGETIIAGTMYGPKGSYGTLFRWSKRNYQMGMPTGGVFKVSSIDSSLLEPYIPVRGGDWSETIERATIDFADYQDWAEEWVVENYPERFTSEWSADINELTNEITIIWEDLTTDAFMPVGFVSRARYITARYFHTKEADPVIDDILVTAGTVSGPIDDELDVPSTTGYFLTQEIEEVGRVYPIFKRVRTIVTYSDATPGSDNTVQTTEDTRTYNHLDQIFRKYTGIIPDPLDEEHILRPKQMMTIWKEPKYTVTMTEDSVDEDMGGGVTKTTTTVTMTPEFDGVLESWYWKEDLLHEEGGYRSKPKMFRYPLGSGTEELDLLDEPPEDRDGYFPMVPVRRHNKMIDEEPLLEPVYPLAKKAWKKVSGGKIEKLIEKVKENENLGDIDHAFVIQGVCLNTLSREGKRYIFTFMDALVGEQTTSSEDYQTYLDGEAARQAYDAEMERWQTEGGEEPTLPVPPKAVRPSKTTLRIWCENEWNNHYDFRISWTTIKRTTHIGKIAVDAKDNATIIEQGATVETKDGFNAGALIGFVTKREPDHSLIILQQDGPNNYIRLEVIGMTHKNYVYGGKSVDNTTKSAMDDPEDSGFIIPLHYSTLKKFPLVRANQLCIESTLIVFNCYVIVKKKWYETFLGQLLIALITMGAGAILSGGASIMAGGGILGSNLAVGGLVGLSGMSAAIVGAVANVIAGQIIKAIISEAIIKIFGAKLGAIIGAITGIVMGSMQGGLLTGGLKINFSDFMRADNLMKLMDGVANAYGVHLQEKTQKLHEAGAEMQKDYARAERDIQEAYIDQFGYGANVDTMLLTNIMEDVPEKGDNFLSRTLMTGSDISDLTYLLISDYAPINLDLDLLKG